MTCELLHISLLYMLLSVNLCLNYNRTCSVGHRNHLIVLSIIHRKETVDTYRLPYPFEIAVGTWAGRIQLPKFFTKAPSEMSVIRMFTIGLILYKVPCDHFMYCPDHQTITISPDGIKGAIVWQVCGNVNWTNTNKLSFRHTALLYDNKKGGEILYILLSRLNSENQKRFKGIIFTDPVFVVMS